MKTFLELVKSRYSVRHYLDKPVDRKLILQCIEAARLAPSAQNVQSWRFLVVDEEPVLDELKKSAFNGVFAPTRWANSAPVIIVILAQTDILANIVGTQIQKVDFYQLDIGIAVEHLVLQATELNLGTCWIGWFNIKAVQKLFKIPKKYKIIGLISMGYFDYNEKHSQKRRKSLDQILFFNHINKKI